MGSVSKPLTSLSRCRKPQNRLGARPTGGNVCYFTSGVDYITDGSLTNSQHLLFKHLQTPSMQLGLFFLAIMADAICIIMILDPELPVQLTPKLLRLLAKCYSKAFTWALDSRFEHQYGIARSLFFI